MAECYLCDEIHKMSNGHLSYGSEVRYAIPGREVAANAVGTSAFDEGLTLIAARVKK